MHASGDKPLKIKVKEMKTIEINMAKFFGALKPKLSEWARQQGFINEQLKNLMSTPACKQGVKFFSIVRAAEKHPGHQEISELAEGIGLRYSEEEKEDVAFMLWDILRRRRTTWGRCDNLPGLRAYLKTSAYRHYRRLKCSRRTLDLLPMTHDPQAALSPDPLEIQDDISILKKMPLTPIQRAIIEGMEKGLSPAEAVKAAGGKWADFQNLQRKARRRFGLTG